MLDDLDDLRLPASGEPVVIPLPHPARYRAARPRRAALALALLAAVGLLFAAGTPLIQPAGQRPATAPTAVSTPGVLTPNPAVVLAPLAWQHVPLPPDAPKSAPYAAAPSDQDTLYLCGLTAADDHLHVWRTGDAGLHWRVAVLPVATNGSSCYLTVAQDDPARVAVLRDDGGNAAPACSRAALFSSRDGGATWRRASIPTPTVLPLGPGTCLPILTRTHLCLWYTVFGGLHQGVSIPDTNLLVRSDDDGATWARSDAGLGASFSLPAPIANARLIEIMRGPPDLTDRLTTVSRSSAGGAPDTLFVTDDGGISWRPLGPMPGVRAFGSLVAITLSNPSGVEISPLYYATSSDQLPFNLYSVRVYSSPYGDHWQALPPLPVPGASAERDGLTDFFGVAVDGRLLAFGVDPRGDVPPTGALPPPETGAPVLWTWNPTLTRWEHSSTPFPVPWPTQQLYCAICWHATITSAANGSSYLWVSANFAPAGIYRAYIPPAAHSALQQHDGASPTLVSP